MGKIVAEQKVGFLHDVVEDSAITIDGLRAEGVEEDVLAAVDLLPHRLGTTDEEYVRNIVLSGNQTVIRSSRTTCTTISSLHSIEGPVITTRDHRYFTAAGMKRQNRRQAQP
jgi:hypothetical protein